MKEFFKVNVSKYDDSKCYDVVRASSLNNPYNNSVMFVTKEYASKWKVLLGVNECIVFWPEDCDVPLELLERHCILRCYDPRLGFALFFRDNKIDYDIKPCEYEFVDGAYIGKGATIGEGTVVFPGCYIDSNVVIGKNCYVGSGARLIGRINIGDNVVIRENVVIGSEALTATRDEYGKVLNIPQFGGVTIGNNVRIDALSIVYRGAIDDTYIQSGCRVSSCCVIGHNVNLGKDTLVVAGACVLGSVSTGNNSYISSNATIRNGITIGNDSFVGMGSVVTRDVLDSQLVKGNPAK